MGVGVTLYERLGVPADADTATLRVAYRRLARLLHPDVAGPAVAGDLDMAQVNEAWRVLSDPQRRRAYDATLGAAGRRPGWSSPRSPAPPASGAPASPGGPAGSPGSTARSPRSHAAGPTSGDAAPSGGAGPDGGATPGNGPQDRGWSANIGARREAWLAGLRLQVRRLGWQAARSAAQTLVIRHRGVPRQPYDALVGPIVEHLAEDTAQRVRLARLGGAAPLDLAIGAALVGLRAYADELVAGGGGGLGPADRWRAAEMIDRMWDTMAHEVPHELAHALGGNPRAARLLRGGAVPTVRPPLPG